MTAAKRLLKGRIGIDSEAGPTEIAILADDTADAAYVAADLISQAEHDPLAASVLVTDSAELADAVEAELDGRSPPPSTPSGSAQALAGSQSAIVLVDDVDAGPRVVNAYAAEHLEIQTARRPRGRRAGAQRRRDLRRAAARRSRSATTAPAPTTCCRPAGCACHSGGPVGADVPARRARRRLRAATRWPRSPTTWRPWPTPRTCPRTAPRCAPGSRTASASR